MWELIKSGGWIMLPIVVCSIIAVAIVAERLWTLRPSRISPPHLLGRVLALDARPAEMDQAKFQELRAGSPLGQILAAGLANSRHGRDIMKESISRSRR